LDDVRQRLERCKASGVTLLLLCDYVDPVRLRPPARDSAIPYQTLLQVCARRRQCQTCMRKASAGRAMDERRDRAARTPPPAVPAGAKALVQPTCRTSMAAVQAEVPLIFFRQ
jgi:hypothetical protein